MTREELIEENKKLNEKIEELENDVDYWLKNSDELEETIENLEEKLVKYNKDYINIYNFIQRLKIDNLYDEKIENYIEEYLKYYKEITNEN